MNLLTAIVPLQLSFAGTAEVGVGYDSTAVNPRNGRYVDAPLLRPAMDLMASHQTETVRQYLRNRAEVMYEGTGGRDVLDSDFFNVTRYGLIWNPNERLELHTDASYAIGAPALFFSRAGRPDVSFATRGRTFQRNLVADYTVRQDLVYHWSDADALQLEAAVTGRYPVTRQVRGQNMFTPYVGTRWTHDFNENNNGHLGARVQYLDLELFRPVWATEAFVGWGRNWDDDTNSLLELGGAAIQSNVGQERLDYQPFVRARIYRRFERLRMVVGASYAHTFGVVSATTGTGVIDVVNASVYWRPGNERGTYFADASLQRGEGYDPVSMLPVTSVFAQAGVGGRYTIRPNLRVFARYDFQWERSDALANAGQPDFVRHLAIVGIQFALATSEEAMTQMLPIDEMQALEHARVGGGQASAVRAPEPQGDGTDAQRRRRSRLPGDPPDDQAERDARERERWNPSGQQAPAPGETQRLPGEGEMRDPVDPLSDEHDGEGQR